MRATVSWGVVFALVHFYWAAGGEVGMGGEAPDTLAAQLCIAFIAVLGLAGTAVAGGLMRRRSGMLVLLARAGAGALLIGVAVASPAGRRRAAWRTTERPGW